MTIMNPEIKAEWVRRLRSGEYKQGHDCLKIDRPDGNTYCCLGVLSEMAVEAGIVKEVYTGPMRPVNFIDTGRGLSSRSIALPSLKVAIWAGMELANPIVTIDDRQHTLSDVNDNLRLDFNQIADLIEEQL